MMSPRLEPVFKKYCMRLNSTYPKGFRADIQGLRAIAVGGVVLDHLNLIPHLGGGYAGVDVFFVISSYLITDHLVRGLEANGHIRFGEFYARRARRILPTALVVVLLTLIASMFLLPVTLRTTSLRDAIATALYVPNYLFAYRVTDYFTNPTPSLYLHYWSLGVEEQFYLVWPLILAMAYRRGIRASNKTSCNLHSPRNALITAVIIAGIFSAWVNFFDLALGSSSRAFFWATGRVWEFAVGGLTALIVSRLPGQWQRAVSIRAGLSWVGLVCIGIAYVHYTSDTEWPGKHAVLPVLGAALIILSGTKKSSLGAGRLLAIRPLQWIGAISYSLYLVHWPLIQFVKASQGYAPAPLSPLVKLGLLALSIIVAWLLYRFVENPLRFSPWLQPVGRSLSLSGVSSLAIVLLAVGGIPIAYYQSHHFLSKHAYVEHVSELTSPPSHITTVVPSNLAPTIGDPSAGSWYYLHCQVSSPKNVATPHSCYYGNRSLPRIALVGDSEAAAIAPAFEVVANKLGFSLEVNSGSGCEFLEKQPGSSFCPAWRRAVLSRLRQNPPDLIVIIEVGWNSFVPVSSDPETDYKKGLADFLSQIGQTPLVIVQIPRLHRFDIPTCLSKHISTASVCAQPAQSAIETNAHRAEAALAAEHPDQVHLVNLTSYFCGPESCPSIIGNTLVWLDNHHPTAAFATLLGPIIAKKLAAIGIRSGNRINKRNKQDTHS